MWFYGVCCIIYLCMFSVLDGGIGLAPRMCGHLMVCEDGSWLNDFDM